MIVSIIAVQLDILGEGFYQFVTKYGILKQPNNS